MRFIRNSCIRIPLSFKDEAFFQQIVSELKRQGKDYYDPEKTVTSKYYSVRDGNLLIPRYFDIERLGHRAVTYLHPGEDIEIEMKDNFSFRDDKQKLALETLIEQDHFVLCMQPGEGKTVLAIAAICKVKKKTIIFVHKDKLAEQWRDRFLEHSKISKDQIALLTTATCRQDLKKPIIISTVQTMCSMINRLDDIEDILAEAKIGMAFWDECHTSVSAEQFSLSSLFLPSPRTYGLSATPKRSDGNTDIIEKHVGTVYIPEGSGTTMEPKIIMLYFDHRAVGDHFKYIYTDFTKKKSDGTHPMRFDKGKYLKMLTSKDDKTYIPMMQKICKQIYQAGRTILLLSDRIKILDKISIVIPKHDVGFFIPRSGEKQDSALYKKFVFSTYGSARDGTDRPEFDTLVLATNCSNIEQAVGRVCRDFPNKSQPIVFDIVDSGCQQMEDASGWRKEFYQSKGWQIEEKRLKLK